MLQNHTAHVNILVHDTLVYENVVQQNGKRGIVVTCISAVHLRYLVIVKLNQIHTTYCVMIPRIIILQLFVYCGNQPILKSRLDKRTHLHQFTVLSSLCEYVRSEIPQQHKVTLTLCFHAASYNPIFARVTESSILTVLTLRRGQLFNMNIVFLKLKITLHNQGWYENRQEYYLLDRILVSRSQVKQNRFFIFI
ncbi:Hypothetical_protein [Hexamita inflata]|uniref:Hypothetical_protein n=1 Tax=Hexamita inflata TaxID=28002 RepID=A0AA86TZ88_9EUKA|nr:Hypothetical protein HINF_LOCUS13546 [Hexamita inflata]CAI9925903.1 Hypothetical protein HINF_LOCUS13548 [Hexamita inflata]